MDERRKKSLAEARQRLERERGRATNPRQLLPEAQDQPQPLNLWNLSGSELDQEMANRLTSLNEDINVRPRGRLTSHRRAVGRLIVLGKRLLRGVSKPYTNLVLDKQVKFNEDLVAFHLASFIRFRQIEEKLAAIEERLNAIEESLERLSDDRQTPPPST